MSHLRTGCLDLSGYRGILGTKFFGILVGMVPEYKHLDQSVFKFRTTSTVQSVPTYPVCISDLLLRSFRADLEGFVPIFVRNHSCHAE